MPRLPYIAALAAVLLVGGCCRESIREMASLKDTNLRPQQRSAAAPTERATKSAAADREENDANEEIETGSVNKPTCQGQHLAYQATKEYLKNFGPKPPDQPGEQGPCNPDAQ
jgi:hypothetical protein